MWLSVYVLYACGYILICGYAIDAVRGYVVVELRAVPDNVAAMRTLSSCGYAINDVVMWL